VVSLENIEEILASFDLEHIWNVEKHDLLLGDEVLELNFSCFGAV